MFKSILACAALALVFAGSPVGAQEEGPAARCSCHMCPIAKAATLDGYKVLSSLPLTNVEEGEFLS